MCGLRRVSFDQPVTASYSGSHTSGKPHGETHRCSYSLPHGAAESSQPEATEEPYVSPIDFEALQGQNPDIYGWLRIPGTEFDFPLVQREGDDSFYLTHDSDGEEDPAGAIFTESAYNSADMEDPVTVAYGHQMIAGTMFGKLQATYSQENALDDYGEIIVYLPERELPLPGVRRRALRQPPHSLQLRLHRQPPVQRLFKQYL